MFGTVTLSLCPSLRQGNELACLFAILIESKGNFVKNSCIKILPYGKSAKFLIVDYLFL